MRKKKAFVYAFISALFHTKKCVPFHKHNEQLSLPLKTKSATGNVTPQTINTRSERTQKGRNEVRSPQPNVTLQYQYIFKCNKDKYMFKMHLQLCRIKEKTFSQQGFFFFVKPNAKELLQANVRGTLKWCLNPG